MKSKLAVGLVAALALPVLLVSSRPRRHPPTGRQGSGDPNGAPESQHP